MEGILAYVKQIEAVEVPEIKDGFKFLQNNWREDEIVDRNFSYDLILEAFPDKKDNFVKVKKIL